MILMAEPTPRPKHQVTVWVSAELHDRWVKSGKRVSLSPLMEEILSRELTKLGF